MKLTKYDADHDTDDRASAPLLNKIGHGEVGALLIGLHLLVIDHAQLDPVLDAALEAHALNVDLVRLGVCLDVDLLDALVNLIALAIVLNANSK